jgi:hypothetical protein
VNLEDLVNIFLFFPVSLHFNILTCYVNTYFDYKNCYDIQGSQYVFHSVNSKFKKIMKVSMRNRDIVQGEHFLRFEYLQFPHFSKPYSRVYISIYVTVKKKDECLVENKCFQEGLVYQATIMRGDNKVDTYIGLTATPFKDRWQNHKSYFKTRNPKNATGLSKYRVSH